MNFQENQIQLNSCHNERFSTCPFIICNNFKSTTYESETQHILLLSSFPLTPMWSSIQPDGSTQIQPKIKLGLLHPNNNQSWFSWFQTYQNTTNRKIKWSVICLNEIWTLKTYRMKIEPWKHIEKLYIYLQKQWSIKWNNRVDGSTEFLFEAKFSNQETTNEQIGVFGPHFARGFGSLNKGHKSTNSLFT